MNTSTSACYDFPAYRPRNSGRKAVPHNLLGSVAVACLVAACGWTIYSNVFGASIYPSVGNDHIDVVAIKRPVAARTSLAAAGSSILIERPPVVSAPAMAPQGSTLSFEDRFAAAAPQSVEPSPHAVAPPRQVAALAPAPDRQAADIVPMPAARPAEAQQAKKSGPSLREMAQRAKAAVLASAAPPEKPSIFERLFGKFQSSSGPALAYASADADATSSLGPPPNIASAGTSTPLYDRQTAVYDISAHMVYLPDGTKLEAHSGLGGSLDDPRSANIRMRGVTPPHLYDLKPREALFHGVAALRLTPVGGEGAIYGRSGLLAHTYMLGPNGDSNGCVSFRDYSAFLNAYRNQGVRRLAVVSHL
jgi:Protein of unknown function (DUF2778)